MWRLYKDKRAIVKRKTAKEEATIKKHVSKDATSHRHYLMHIYTGSARRSQRRMQRGKNNPHKNKHAVFC